MFESQSLNGANLKKKKVAFSSDNWKLINVASSPIKKKIYRNSQLIAFKSGLLVRSDIDHKYFFELSNQTSNGYTQENSQQALKRFVKRKIIEIVSIKNIKEVRNLYSSEIITNVLQLNIKSAKFTAKGSTLEQAEKLCMLKLLNSLYVNNVIKEANIEFNKRRKAFMDSSKDLDLRLQGYLGCDLDTFAKILDNITLNDNYFY